MANFDSVVKLKRPTPPGDGNRLVTTEKMPSQRRFMRGNKFWRTGCHHIAAQLASARADIDHMVGRVDNFLVVLNNDNRVIHVAQGLKRFQQTAGVFLVQAYRRLVKHIHHPNQSGADLRGQPYALRLTARERIRRSR